MSLPSDLLLRLQEIIRAQEKRAAGGQTLSGVLPLRTVPTEDSGGLPEPPAPKCVYCGGQGTTIFIINEGVVTHRCPFHE